MRDLVNKKYILIQVIGVLYRCVSFTFLTCNNLIYRYLPVSIKNDLVLLSSIFEQTNEEHKYLSLSRGVVRSHD